MHEQLRVGLIGAGPWATRIHAPGIADHPGVRLSTVWARRADAAAGPHGGKPDPDELIAGVDAVAFAVPPAVQAQFAIPAAKAGKHLILEKPLASTVDEAERLADAVSDAELVALVMLTNRYAHDNAAWLDEINRLGGWTGGTVRLLTNALLDGPFSGSPWRQAEGSLSDIGPHAFDLIDASLGTITDVLAASYRPEHDLWHVMFGHDSGATSTAAIAMRLPARPGAMECTVYGEHGLRALAGSGASASDCFAAMLDDFVAMVHSGTTTHRCDARRGLHLQRVVDAVRRKANSPG